MNWLLIAIIAQFLFALVFVIDKLILSKTVLRPIVYASSVGLFEIFALVLFVFDFSLLSLKQIIIAFSAGALNIFALVFFYKSIEAGEVSRVVPIVGGAVPLGTLILSYFILVERLAVYQLFAFFLLVIGGVIMVWPRKIKERGDTIKTPLYQRLPIALVAAAFFSGAFVLATYIYNEQSFINGFVWIRMGGFIAGLALLFWPGNRQRIVEAGRKIRIKAVSLFVSSKLLAGLAFILLNYAFYLGSVSLVNALQGIQYVFLLVIGIILSKKFPQILREQISQEILARKIAAILLIGLGVGLLSL